MNTRISKKYYLIPLFYIGLIGALLYLQFAREEPFHLRFGSIEVTGHIIAGKTNPPVLADISLKTNGLVFHFTRSTPVRVELENGSSQFVSLKSYSSLSNGIQLSFSSNLSLRFVVQSGERDTVSIVPSMPKGVQVSSVSFPYSVTKGDRTKSSSGIPVLAITRQTASGPQTHVLSLPFKSEIRSSDDIVVLSATGGKFGPATYRRVSKPNLDPVVYWFAQNGNLPNSVAFEKAVKDYLDKAWSGWTTRRFDARTGTWKMRDGSPVFKESIVAAILSEALARGSYGTWLDALKNTAALHANDITIETTPFFGNVVNTFAPYAATQAGTLHTIEERLRNGEDAALDLPGLLTFAADHGSESTAQKVLSKMESAKTDTMRLQAVLSLIGDDLAAEKLGYSGNRYTKAAVALIDRRVLPSIIPTKNGLFLQTENGVSDIASSVLAGRLLIEAGTRTEDSIVDEIGRRLIISALALSDNVGFLPGRLAISGDAVSGTEGFLAAEKIYPWIAPDAYYPREIPLGTQVGTGVWAWAASRITSVVSTRNQLAVTFDFPVGRIEHIVLHGIKPFTGIRLYGIAWRSDPEFERYNAGWVYDAASKTLFIKLQHRRQDETVDIVY
jgi:hypothetical protein